MLDVAECSHEVLHGSSWQWNSETRFCRLITGSFQNDTLIIELVMAPTPDKERP